MPANLTPEYKAAEAAFRRARDPRERLERLREMLRVIPKHKGTDHLQGDIKRRIKELSEELERPKKSGAHGGPPLVIQPEGAAQIALLGPPNTGKSSLHARLTGSGAQAAPYPFTTQYPEPGMMPYEDIHFQLVDLPAISPEHPVSWLASALQTADACLLVVDLGDPACVERIEALHVVLREKGVTLTDRWEPEREPARGAAEADEDPFALR
ncbi:MAG TPA: GTPase, partial [Candidatus Acidoferrum sp.]|nr:GTPase [Candidatus Acidoferrum sp.]